MKKMLLKLLPMLMLIGWSAILNAQTVITTAGSATVCPGEVTIPVNVTGFSGVGAFTMVLKVNPSVLAYLNYQNVNPALSNGNFLANAVNGDVFLTWYSTNAVSIPNGGLLLELKFTGSVGSCAVMWDTQTPGHCEYSNVNGQIISSAWINGNVTINSSPIITGHPSDILILAGNNATFSFSATGANLSFRWQISLNDGNTWTDLSDGGYYSNVTGATLYISGAPLTLNGTLFRCMVNGTCQPPALTNSALLTVVPFIHTNCQSVTMCPGEIIVPITVSDFNNVGAFTLTLNINPANMTYLGFQNLNPGLPAGNFNSNLVNGKLYLSWYGINGVTLPNGLLLELKFTGMPGAGTLDWDLTTPGNCEYSNANGSVLFSTWSNGNITVQYPPAITINPANQTINNTGNTHFSMTATGTGMSYQWQVSTNGGGAWFDLTNDGHYSNVNSPDLYINNVPLSWNGNKYRCRVAGTCLPVVYTNSASLTVLPLIVTTCQSVTSCPGEVVVPISVGDFIDVGAFTMTLTYNPNLFTYNGYQGFNPILANGIYTINESAGKVYISWFHTTAATLSNGAILTELKFIGIPGSGSFNWDTQTPGNCEYSSPNGQIIFSSWVDGSVVVNQAPTFTTQPVPQMIYAGGMTTFAVNFTGTGVNSQWQQSTNNGSTWTDLVNEPPYSGVNTTALTINPVAASLNGYLFRCYINGTCPPFQFSTSASLTVTPAAINTSVPNISNSCTSSLDLPVQVTNCNNVGGITLALHFDPAVTSFEGYHSVNSQLLNGILAINHDVNTVYLSWVSMVPANISNGNLVFFKFKTNPGVSTSLNWDVQTPGSCEYSNINGTVITSFYNNANISVSSNALNVNAGIDVATNPGIPVQLTGTASGGNPSYIYLWSPATGLSNPGILNPIAMPASTTIYTLSVTDNNNCVGTDAMQITISNNIPQVTTGSISDITFQSASGGGHVNNDGGDPVTSRGVCWSITSSPTIYDPHTTDGSGLGTFNSYITGLAGSTHFFVRAYATNSIGTSYGDTISFTTLEPPVNIAPTINPIPNPLPVYEDAGQQTIVLSGIDDGNPEQTQTISISAISTMPSVIPNPAINYTPNNTAGMLNYTPASNAYGNATIIVTVMDNGGTSNGGVNITTTSFNVVVLPVNDPPVANAGPDQSKSTGQAVILDGSGSYDVDGNLFAYLWTAPLGITLSSPATAHPSFTTPFSCTDKTYTFSLVVNDGATSSSPDYVSVNVSSASPVIDVHPFNLTETLFIGNASNQEIKIRNEGACNLSFNVSDPTSWLTVQPNNGTVSPGDSIMLTVHFIAENLGAGTFQASIYIHSNDPTTPTVTIPVTFLVLQPLEVQVNALPSSICLGGSSQLNANATGGSGVYTYMWFSDPAGFVSNTQNPLVNPGVNTTYQIMVSDGQFTTSAFVPVSVYQNHPPGVVANMLPSDSSTLPQPSVTFSWQPATNANRYDLYVWKTTDLPAAQPVVSNITGIQLAYNNLNYATTYNWKLVAKNPCGQQSSSAVQTFIVADLSDLIVNNIQVPVNASTGQQVEISWNTFNQGNNSTLSSSWYDVVYLSQDTILNTEVDTYLGGLSNLTSLSPNTGYSRTLSVNLPESIFGNLYVLVHTDYYSQVPEMTDLNNLSHQLVTIALTPPPDLQVTAVNVPTICFSGSVINVEWTSKNFGLGGILNKSWNDKIYLSTQQVFNPQNATYLGEKSFSTNLAPGISYPGSLQVSVPPYIYGNYYIYIYTDANNTVFEHANENNNILRSSLFEIVLTPPPDLTVQNIQHPVSASNNEQITIQWTSKNTGASPTNSPWQDKIFLCPTPVFHEATSVPIGTKQFNVVLQPGATMPANILVTAPDNLAGIYYVFVYTDYLNQIFEHLNENNNIIKSPDQIEIKHADLTVIQTVVPDTSWSGRSIMVGWKVLNMGTGNVINKTITDKIFLSQSRTYPIVNPAELGTLAYSNPLSSWDTIQKNRSVALPDGISGKYYLFVKTNVDNNVFENQLLINNYLTDSLTINLSPYPDLVIDSISSPDTIVLGYSNNIHYRGKNVGDTSIFGKVWIDGFYISNSNILDTATASKLAPIQVNQSLNPGSSYPENFQVLLPIDEFQGMSQGWLHFLTDVENNIFEMEENNNIISSPAIKLITPPKVDLTVTAASTATDTTQSGKSVNFSYTVKNLSTPTSIWEITQWYDAVYLSVDTIWNPGDQLISEWQKVLVLQTNGTYSENRSLTIPHGLSGNYYFLVVADHSKLNNDLNYINNSKPLRNSVPIYIRPTLYPDLNAVEFIGPINGMVGQPAKFRWKVSNQGVGPTTNNSWTDKIYLSSDFTISSDDILIGSKAIFQTLGINANYRDSMEITLPGNVSGNYIVIFKTDASNVVYETGQGESNNVAFSGISLIQPMPSDLIIQDISFPAAVETGQVVTINYKNQNIGPNPANGYMKDILYFSSDSSWSFTDPKFGMKENHISLAPQMSQENAVNSTVPGLLPGDYFVIVQTNVLNNIPEVSFLNNTGISSTKLTVTIPSLLLGVQKQDILTDNVGRYYEIAIPPAHAGEAMIITLKADSLAGMNELYLSADSIPTRSNHTFSATEPFKGNQELIVPELHTGKYYLLVYGSTANGNTQAIQLLADILPFEIRSVNASQGGNKGKVTVMLQGARFENNMQVKLSNGNTSNYIAENLTFINSTKLFATFNLNNANLGFYNVVATKSDNSMATLPNGFEIVTGSSGTTGTDTTGFECFIENIGFEDQINTDIQHPASTRPNRIVVISIHFGNSGNVDIPAPGRLLVSLTGVPLSFTPEDFSANKKELYIEFKENNGPPGILRPGAQGTVTVYTKATVIATLEFVLTR